VLRSIFRPRDILSKVIFIFARVVVRVISSLVTETIKAIGKLPDWAKLAVVVVTIALLLFLLAT
jgi:cytochrome b561